ncbi:MAG: glycoside hydrolase family 25 protein [Alphaproteobacteria bacterium]|nr:glycoside hydrolase family 25 protein [Alphaproteobacteria bacterium]MBV9814719.1 glycoside hydrolase family 25 protein [Alphaproteobacteria bacterium]
MSWLSVDGERQAVPPRSSPYNPPVTSDVVIDLSHWQAPVDFARAKSAGIAAVILKATQGSDWIDVAFAQRFAAATAAGLLVGAYHFLDDSPPESQVENFLSVAGGCSVLALDAEPNAIGGTVTVAQAAEAAGRLNMATGSMPLIYINRYGPDQRGTGLPNSVLSRCPLWLPAYNARPVCPLGWSKWTLWQHTDGTIGPDAVPVPGLGRCDRSRFAGTTADLNAWWKKPLL